MSVDVLCVQETSVVQKSQYMTAAVVVVVKGDIDLLLKGSYESTLLGLLVVGKVCWHPGAQPSQKMGVKHWRALLLFSLFHPACFVSDCWEE